MVSVVGPQLFEPCSSHYERVSSRVAVGGKAIAVGAGVEATGTVVGGGGWVMLLPPFIGSIVGASVASALIVGSIGVLGVVVGASNRASAASLSTWLSS